MPHLVTFCSANSTGHPNDEKTDVAHHPLLRHVCHQLLVDKDMTRLSLNMLPTWNLSREDWSLLSIRLEQNTTLKSIELALDRDDAFGQDILNFLSTSTLMDFSLITDSDRALELFLGHEALLSSLQRIHLEWKGGLLPRNTQEKLYTTLRYSTIISLIGIAPLVTSGNINRWREVTLQGCDLTRPDTMEWFAHAQDLQSLQIRCSRFSPETYPALAKTTNSLQCLDLAQNDLDHQDCQYLSNWLDSLPHLKSLKVHDNPNIGSMGLKNLCQTVCHTLSVMDVAHCQITSIEPLLETFPFLTHLNVSENPLQNMWEQFCDATHLQQVTAESMTCGLSNKSLEEWIKISGVTILDLSGNWISPNVLTSLFYFSGSVLKLNGCHLTNDDLHTLLRSKRSWRELHLSYNRITNLNGIKTAFRNQRLPQLESLHLHQNPLTETSLTTCIPHTLQVLQISSSIPPPPITQPAPSSPTSVSDELQHSLMLNRAGKSLLYKDYPLALWPWILDQAQQVYGRDAIFDFLRHRPDLLSR